MASLQDILDDLIEKQEILEETIDTYPTGIIPVTVKTSSIDTLNDSLTLIQDALRQIANAGSASGTLPTSRVDMASECLQLAEDAKAENDAITPNLNVIGSKLKTLRWFISDANGGFEWMIMRGD